MNPSPPTVFLLDDSDDFARSLATALGGSLAPLEQRSFEDGEHKLRPLIPVRGDDVCVVCRLAGTAERSVDERIMRLLFLVATLRDHGARRISVIAPYLPYARKDRRTRPHDPLTLRYLAQLLETAGVARLAVMDVHNLAAFENAFRCETLHLEAAPWLIDALVRPGSQAPLAVLSPDTGGIKRAEQFRELLEQRTGRQSHLVFLEKYRRGDRVWGDGIVGRLSDCQVVIVDDLVAGGTTLSRALDNCAREGVKEVVAVASHGVFSPGAEALLAHPALHRLVVTDSVDSNLLRQSHPRLDVIPVAPIVAEAVSLLFRGGL